MMESLAPDSPRYETPSPSQLTIAVRQQHVGLTLPLLPHPLIHHPIRKHPLPLDPKDKRPKPRILRRLRPSPHRLHHPINLAHGTHDILHRRVGLDPRRGRQQREHGAHEVARVRRHLDVREDEPGFRRGRVEAVLEGADEAQGLRGVGEREVRVGGDVVEEGVGAGVFHEGFECASGGRC